MAAAHPTPVGRITGRSVTELRFRVGPDEPVHLGEILLAEDDHNGPPFYLRVVDLEFGSDARDGAWEERTAGALLASPGSDDVVLFDREERLFKTAIAAPLGYLQADGRFRKPKTLPAHFAAIRRPLKGDFGFLAPKKGDLELGHLRSGDEALPDRLGLDPRALAQHLGVFATTGMGKSNLLKVLAGACLDSGHVGMLVLDPHGEYADGGAGTLPDGRPLRGLLHHPRADRLHVYTSRAIPGFAGRIHELAISAGEITAADFGNVYHVTDAQEEALWGLWSKFGRTWIAQTDKLEVEELDAVLGRGKYHPGTLSVLKRRCEAVLAQPVIHRDAALSTTKAILGHLESGHTVLVDTSGLHPAEELLVSAVLARSLLERYRDAARDPEHFRSLPPACVTLEEAQRVLNARGGSSNIFAQIAREGRKFKVGLGAVTQQPRLLTDELLSQLNTLFILGLADPSDRDRIKAGARQDLSQVAKEIQMMEPGEALVTTPGAPFALPLKAHLYEDRIIEVAANAPTVSRVAVKPKADFY